MFSMFTDGRINGQMENIHSFRISVYFNESKQYPIVQREQFDTVNLLVGNGSEYYAWRHIYTKF